MKYLVCSTLCGSGVILGEFNTEYEAEEFIKKPCPVYTEEHVREGQDQEYYYPYEMHIEEKGSDTMYIVCTDYFGITIELEAFENEDLANEFIKYPYELYSEDESEDGTSEVISPDRMWIEERNILPVTDFLKSNDCLEYADELPPF